MSGVSEPHNYLPFDILTSQLTPTPTPSLSLTHTHTPFKMTTMRAAFTTAYGGPDKIEYSDSLPKVKLGGDDHVLIRVADASINPIDGLRNRGMLRILMCDDHPHVFGYDVGGFVEEVGSKCTNLKVGDRVYGRIGESQSGTLAGYVSAQESVIAVAPTNLPLSETAGVPLVGLTAYQALRAGDVQPGQRVFISKGAGGVGTIAIQLAKHVFGAYVITTGSDHKAELLKELELTRSSTTERKSSRT